MLGNRNVPEGLLGFDIALTMANASDESLLGFFKLTQLYFGRSFYKH